MSAKEYFKDWYDVIDMTEINKILNILNPLYQSKNITPAYQDIFKAFTLCDRKDCRIIMLGQDCYPQKGVATGLAFANREGTDKISPSLGVLKEACINYELPHEYIDFDVTLESWAKQGILLLNSALTCEVNRVGSHINLWRPFISKLLQKLSNVQPGILYVLFGNQAQSFLPYINTKANQVMKVRHPAYYARIGGKMPYAIFTDINNVIHGINGDKIIWYQERKPQDSKCDSFDMRWDTLPFEA